MMMSQRDATILVVDDDEDTTSVLCDLLQKRGYRAEAFTSGRRCLEYLRSEVADVVLTDVLMCGMTGIELCRELQVRHPDLLTIVLTGADLEHAIGAIGDAAYDFIRKPVRFELLEIAIKRALEHLALRREVHRLRLESAIAEEISGTSPANHTTSELTWYAAANEKNA